MSYLTPYHSKFTAAEIESILDGMSGMTDDFAELSAKVDGTIEEIVSLWDRITQDEGIFDEFSAYVEERFDCLADKVGFYEIKRVPEPDSGDAYTYILVNRRKDPEGNIACGDVIHVPECEFADKYKEWLDAKMKPELSLSVYGEGVPMRGKFGVPIGYSAVVDTIGLAVDVWKNMSGDVIVYYNGTEIGRRTLTSNEEELFYPYSAIPLPYGNENHFTAVGTDISGRTISASVDVDVEPRYACFLTSNDKEMSVESGDIVDSEDYGIIENDVCPIDNINDMWGDYLWMYCPSSMNVKWVLLDDIYDTVERETSEVFEGFERMASQVAVNFNGSVVLYDCYRSENPQIEYTYRMKVIFEERGTMYVGASPEKEIGGVEGFEMLSVDGDKGTNAVIEHGNGEYIWLCLPHSVMPKLVIQDIVYNITSDFVRQNEITLKGKAFDCYRTKAKQTGGIKDLKIIVKPAYN